MAHSKSSVAPSEREYPVLSRQDVGQLIAKGHKVIIVSQHVLKVDPWIKYHPGGDLAILHMVGRDATDEVNALVSPPPRLLAPNRVGPSANYESSC